MFKFFYQNKHASIITTGTFLLFQLILWIILGTNSTNEAEKYIREANSLYTQHQFTEPKFVLYLPIIVSIYLSKLFSLGYEFVILLQIVCATVAFYFFQKSLRYISNPTKWCIGVFLYLLCFPLHQWNCYLYSDAFFFSFVTIFISSCIILHKQNKTTGLLYLLIVFSFLLLFTRPSGLFIFLSNILLLWIFLGSKNNRVSLLFVSLFFLLTSFWVVRFSFSGSTDFNLLIPYVEEHIICLVPSQPTTNLDLLNSGHVLNDFVYYIAHNFSHFSKLIAKRFLSFFNPYRIHYSAVHNSILLIYFIAVYLFFISGVKHLYVRSKKILALLLIPMLFYTIGILLQCDDWSNRFVTALLPLFIMMGSTSKK